jgi:toxin FitB
VVILLDTNILSELMRPSPAREVEAWLSAQPAEGVFISAVTEAGLRFDVALLPDAQRREALSKALEGMPAEDFAGRI